MVRLVNGTELYDYQSRNMLFSVFLQSGNGTQKHYTVIADNERNAKIVFLNHIKIKRSSIYLIRPAIVCEVFLLSHSVDWSKGVEAIIADNLLDLEDKTSQ